MRARNIKPGFFRNEDLAELPPLTRILFSGLWCVADREGRLEDRPKRIRADVLPYDDCDVDAMLDQLAASGFIQRYTVDGGRYINVITFHDHQKPHVREADSTIPAPPEPGDTPPSIEEGMTKAMPRHDLGDAKKAGFSDSLIPDSLIADTGFSDSSVAVRADARPRAVPKPAERERDELWDAVAAAVGKPMTRNEQSDFGKTISQLREAAAAPEQVAGFRDWWFGEHGRDITLTHRCYRDHWGRYINAPPKPPPSITELHPAHQAIAAYRREDNDDLQRYLERQAPHAESLPAGAGRNGARVVEARGRLRPGTDQSAD